jgi:hypothetical protein
MRVFPIRYLIFLSAACLNYSCNSYSHMQKIQPGPSCVQKFKPDFSHVLYQTSVDVVGKHISGILLIKFMHDSSTRIVFSNETGFSFFDFGFMQDNGFTVYQITPGMNKKALIRTLRKDFDLLLFRNMDNSKYYALADSSLVYHAYPQSKGINYYITDSNCLQLVKMQRSSNKKPIMEAFMEGAAFNNSPDSIFIRHLNFNFSIALKKISGLAPQ